MCVSECLWLHLSPGFEEVYRGCSKTLSVNGAEDIEKVFGGESKQNLPRVSF